MQVQIKTAPEELMRAKRWWKELELQWQFAYNEAVFGKGPVMEPPKDDELMLLLVRADALRFAGPGAVSPNMSQSLTNLSGLIPLFNLTYLSLTNTSITCLTELRRHTKLKHLFVYDNKLTSLEGIEGMSGLEELYAQNNEITSLKPIKRLTKLINLYIPNNRLTTLKGLTKKHANTMKHLYVQPNEDLPDREIIRFQNKVGIICRTG